MASSSSLSEATQEERESSAEERALTGLLSDDTLLHMMHCLPSRELLTSLALVCRRWHRLCASFSVYELVPCSFSRSDRPWGSTSEKELIELAVSYASTVERVSLHGLKHLRSNDIISLCRSLPKLRNLSIVSCPLLVSTDLESIASQLPTQLVSLDLHTDHFAISRCHDCIHTPPPLIHDGFLGSLHQRCSLLQKLNLDSCSYITQQGLDRLLEACPSLTSLDLHSHALGWPEVAKIFTSCKQLCHFSLVSPLLIQTPSSSDDESMDGFPWGCSRGRGMNSRAREDLHDSGGISLGHVMPKNLRSVRLYSSPHRSVPLEVTPMLGMLRTSGHQLRHLHAQGVFNTSWQTISVWCAHLKLLDLSHCRQGSLNLTGVEGVVLCGLIRLLKKLEYIALPAATDSILLELGQFCPNLREIRFQGYGLSNSSNYFQLVTDRGVVAVAEGCPDLRLLSLAGCRKITITSARALAFHCRSLKVLVLSRCRSFKDDAVSALLPRLSCSLLVLDLVGCKITQTTLKSIAEYAAETSLRVLAIPKPVWNASHEEISQIKRRNGVIQIRMGGSGIVWDGFYHGIFYD